MKIIITGDWHVKKGIYSQLILDYLDDLWSFYKRESCEYIFVIGDVLNKSSSIKNEAYIPLFLKLLQMKEDGVKFIFLLGNHDIFNVSRDSIVETFSPMGEVIKEPVERKIDGKDFFFVPYTKKEDEFYQHDSADFLITHVPIADFSFDNAFHATEKHAFKKNVFESFKRVFTGHFHRHQTDKNICYVGSPYQMNLGEKNQQKGFVVFDTTKEIWDFIKYDNAPQYLEINEDNIINIKEINFENKFVIIRVTKKIKNYSKLKHLIFERGAISVDPIFETEKDADGEEKSNLSVKKNIDEIVLNKISETKEENLDSEKLVSILRGVM